MASRMKEDERNEKIIRGLMKLPPNRRCINCNSLGPQYVCTNFWTFICTNCSGLHREFTHRVKSISMAKFATQEVNALREGGNERAKEIYFKEWDPQRHFAPDSSDVDRLREFIKHVYVDRRYTGERSTDRPPRGKGEEEYRSYHSGSRSPPSDDTFEHRSGDPPNSIGRNDDRNFRYSSGERSPGSDSGDYTRSPGSTDIDDRHRYNRYGNGNKNQGFEDRRFADGVQKPEGMTPDTQKRTNASSPPVACSVQDILGNGAPLPRIKPPMPNGIRAPDSAAQGHSTASSSTMESGNKLPVEVKQVSTTSLIDFTAETEPPVTAAAPPLVTQQVAIEPANDQNWASFDVVSHQKEPQATSYVRSLESVLADLSITASAPASNFSALPGVGVSSSPATNNGAQFPATQQHFFSVFPATSVHATRISPSVPLVGASNIERPLSALPTQFSQAITKPPEESSAVLPQPSASRKMSGRKELPVDLFTSLYPPGPAQVQPWQLGGHIGMGYGMQYPAATTVPAFSPPVKAANPFDLINEPTPVRSRQFPSLSSLQGALPNMNHPSTLMRASSLDAPTAQWMPLQQTSYPPVSQSPYVVQQDQRMQQVPNNMFLTMHQGVGGLGIHGTAFSALGMEQLQTVKNPLPGTPNAFAPVGGNPFG